MTVTNSDLSFPIAILPIHPDNDYPHAVHVDLQGIVYRFIYDFLAYDGSMIMQVEREMDRTVMWRGRVCLKNRWRVRDPTTGVFRLGFFANKVSRDDPEIFVWVNTED